MTRDEYIAKCAGRTFEKVIGYGEDGIKYADHIIYDLIDFDAERNQFVLSFKGRIFWFNNVVRADEYIMEKKIIEQIRKIKEPIKKIIFITKYDTSFHLDI